MDEANWASLAAQADALNPTFDGDYARAERGLRAEAGLRADDGEVFSGEIENELATLDEMRTHDETYQDEMAHWAEYDRRWDSWRDA